MTQDSAETTNWATGALHQALVVALPAFVKDPFDAAPRLDILKLRTALKRSHETVYGWLRANKLSPKGARSIAELANTDVNVTALTQLGRTPPQVEDFARFVLA